MSTLAIQRALNQLGSNLPRLSEDGRYGPATRARVMEFQADNGIYATGIMDDQTAAQLQWMTGVDLTSNADLQLGQAAAEAAYAIAVAQALANQGAYSGASVNGTVNNVNDPGTVNNSDVLTETLNAALERARALAKAGGAGAHDALQLLADHGDLFAKLALSFGVGLAAAQMIALGIGGVVLLIYLKAGK